MVDLNAGSVASAVTKAYEALMLGIVALTSPEAWVSTSMVLAARVEELNARCAQLVEERDDARGLLDEALAQQHLLAQAALSTWSNALDITTIHLKRRAGQHLLLDALRLDVASISEVGAVLLIEGIPLPLAWGELHTLAPSVTVQVNRMYRDRRPVHRQIQLRLTAPRTVLIVRGEKMEEDR